MQWLEILLGGAGGGALGGIVGSMAGIFKSSQENRHREAMARIDLSRDKMEITDRRDQRNHESQMQAKAGEIALKRVFTEGNIAADIEGMKQRGTAVVSEFSNLNTAGWVDSFRGMIRPMVATSFTIGYFVMLGWAFYQYREQLTATDGKELLMLLVTTLCFSLTSCINFYFFARRNAKPHL